MKGTCDAFINDGDEEAWNDIAGAYAEIMKVDEDEDDVMRKAADAKKASFFDRTDDQHDAIAKGRHKSHPGGIPKGTDFDPKKEKPQRRAGAAKRMRSRIREANSEE